jgi:hypothetical protein
VVDHVEEAVLHARLLHAHCFLHCVIVGVAALWSRKLLQRSKVRMSIWQGAGLECSMGPGGWTWRRREGRGTRGPPRGGPGGGRRPLIDDDDVLLSLRGRPRSIEDEEASESGALGWLPSVLLILYERVEALLASPSLAPEPWIAYLPHRSIL